MQFTDRELFYTDRIWRSRSVRTERSVRKISPSHSENEIFWVPLMICNLRPWTLLYGPYLTFIVFFNNKNFINNQPQYRLHIVLIWRSWSVRTVRTETIVSRSVTVRVYWTTLPPVWRTVRECKFLSSFHWNTYTIGPQDKNISCRGGVSDKLHAKF